MLRQYFFLSPWLALGINAQVGYRMPADHGVNCNRTRGCKCCWNRLIGGKCSGLLEPIFSVPLWIFSSEKKGLEVM